MIFKLIAATALALGMTSMASAQVFIHGPGKAKDCYMSVKMGDPGRKSTIKHCQEAFKEDMMSVRDRASNHVNIGILQMRAGDYEASLESYERAMSIRPKLDKIYINRAAALINTGQHEEAVADATKALDLDTDKPLEALFNRSIAYDHLQKYDLAYYDLKEALRIDPEWHHALKAIRNYEVTSQRPSS